MLLHVGCWASDVTESSQWVTLHLPVPAFWTVWKAWHSALGVLALQITAWYLMLCRLETKGNWQTSAPCAYCSAAGTSPALVEGQPKQRVPLHGDWGEGAAQGQGRPSWAVTWSLEAPLQGHTALDKEARCEEMGGSLSHGSRQHNEIWALPKSVAKLVDFSCKEFYLGQGMDGKTSSRSIPGPAGECSLVGSYKISAI